MRTLRVNLGDRSYPIHIGTGLIARAGELMGQSGIAGKVGIVTNPVVAGLYLGAVEESLRRAGFQVTTVLIPNGEEHKNLDSLASIYDRFIAARFERGSSLVALGGGVVGDLAGFAAATFLRGIPYVQIPTTLLAQVDSSVGGKTGINHPRGKNLIGAFYQPKVVIIDLDALRSLPVREFGAGLAEVIKYGIIKDPELFSFLEGNLERLVRLEPEDLERVVAESCAIKAAVVEEDEYEQDYRAVLNFGHTIGHALEAATRYEALLHGEAVAVGMVQAAILSRGEGLCDEETVARIRRLVEKAGLPGELPVGVGLARLVEGLSLDKKSTGGKIKFVLCRGIGEVEFGWLTAQQIIARLGA